MIAIFKLPALILFLCVLAFAYYTETRVFGIYMVMLMWLLFFAVARVFWLGSIMASYVATALIAVIYVASKLKFVLMGRRLHPFDLYQYFNFDSAFYAIELYPRGAVHVAAIVVVTLLIGVAIVTFERFRRPDRWVAGFAAFVVLLAGGTTLASSYMDGKGYGPGNRFLHFDHQHVSTFAISTLRALPELITDTPFEMGALQQIEVAAIDRARQNTCHIAPDAPAPNILVILRESAMIPSDLPAMGSPNVDESYFRSFDRKTRRLRVETHGAGSAFTIFNLLTGISAEAFGGFKILALDLSPGRIKFTLPKLLQGCGYRNVAITTGFAGYVATEPFYAAMGFEKYYDLADVRARSGGDISDRGVYLQVEDELLAPSKKPIFAYIDTTVAHYPYANHLRPDEHVPEADRISNPEVAEYVRRLMLGERDLEALIARHRQRALASKRPLVVLDFGDHQPPFTTVLPGHPGYVNEDRRLDDQHLVTWFRIRSPDYPLKAIPMDHEIVDAPFMGDWLLKALGFDVKGVYELRAEMLTKCKSRYWRCDNARAADRLHQTMQAAGLLDFTRQRKDAILCSIVGRCSYVSTPR